MADFLYYVRADAVLGESPVWSPRDNALYWIDIKKPAIHRFDPDNQSDTSWPVSQEIGSIALREAGGLIAAFRDGFAIVDPEGARIEWLNNPEADQPLSRFNDGKCDRQGRFWSGTMHDPAGPPPLAGHADRDPVGALYRLDADHKVHCATDHVLVSNGLAWSPDGTIMYFADSPTRTISAFDYDIATGAVSNRRVFAEVPERPGRGTPDGATVDEEGCYWCAEFRGSRIVRYTPDGKVDRMLELPVSRVTSCAFGGADMRTLFVTTAQIMLSEAELAAEPLAGGLFALDVGVGGLPETPYKG